MNNEEEHWINAKFWIIICVSYSIKQMLKRKEWWYITSVYAHNITTDELVLINQFF